MSEMSRDAVRELYDLLSDGWTASDAVERAAEKYGFKKESLVKAYIQVYGSKPSEFTDTPTELTSEEIQVLDEAIAAKKKRIKPADRIKRKKFYRANKAKLKRAGKKYRKSSAGKRHAKKAKRMGKRGKTASGKRKTKFI